MKHVIRPILSLTLLVLPLVLVAGCPSLDPTTAVNPLTDLNGVYWVDYVKDELVIFELPEQRGDEDALWWAVQVDTPDWYTGPGLYSTEKSGTWRRLTVADGLTLDAIVAFRSPLLEPADPNAPLGVALSGLYWVEYHADAGELALYRLPEYRDEEGTWSTTRMNPPEWYTGPGLYEATEYFQWERLTTNDDLTLDDVLTLYDFRPRPPGDPAEGAPSGG